jgi:voltage-gated potassium channel
MNSLKRYFYHVLVSRADRSIAARLIRIFIVLLIVLNLLSVVIETVNDIALLYAPYFLLLEEITIVAFSIEYVLRAWVCTLDKNFRHPINGRIKYLLSPIAIVDLLAIVPFYLLFIVHIDIRTLSMLRTFRILRIFKLRRYAHGLDVIFRVILTKLEELAIVFSTLLIMLVVVSSVMFYLERDYQPEIFSSIPHTMWWGVATLTTIGYGDMVPITMYGKLFGSIVALIGLAMFALPAAILTSGFTEHMREEKLKHEMRKAVRKCPHCHQPLHDFTHDD